MPHDHLLCVSASISPPSDYLPPHCKKSTYSEAAQNSPAVATKVSDVEIPKLASGVLSEDHRARICSLMQLRSAYRLHMSSAETRVTLLSLISSSTISVLSLDLRQLQRGCVFLASIAIVKFLSQGPDVSQLRSKGFSSRT